MDQETLNEAPTLSLEDQYTEVIVRARKEFPALIKRMSNKIAAEEKSRLIDPNEPEFNPNFEYPNLFDLDDAAIAEKTAIIQENIAAAKSLEDQGYRLSIENEFDRQKALDGLTNLRLLVLARQLQTESDPERKEQLTKEFIELNEQMTGAIDQSLYQGIVNTIYETMQGVSDSQPVAKKISNELAEMLPNQNGTERVASLPDDVFEQYRHAYYVIFGKWIAEIIPKKEGLYDANDMAEVFWNALKSMKLDELGWKVEVDEDAISMKISMEDQTITVPSKRKPLSYEQLAPKVVHEVGHITRGLNGSHISRSAEHGLPDYLDAEEGLMSYGESFISGKQQVDVTYVERYLGAGLVSGSLDGNKKDFKQVFSAMWRARILLENAEKLERGEDINLDDIADAKESSLMNAQRLFRGGNGIVPGLGWTKDKAYYEGVAKLTDFMVDFAQRIGLENVHWLFAAKFDPTNSLHNRYLGMPLKGQ